MPTNAKHSDAYYRALAKEIHEVEGECEIDETAIVSRNNDGENGCYVAAWVWVDDPMLGDLDRSEFDEWDTRCPNCGVEGELRVFQVTLTRTGQVHQIDAKLDAGGFLVDLDEDKDQSTDDERVRCDACKAEFTLEELMLPTHEDQETCRICGGNDREGHRILGCNGEEIVTR